MSEAAIDKLLCSRLRAPATPWSVEQSLPVLFFGDLYRAEVATVGLNPSQQEYLSPSGELLYDADQRFATLETLRASDRASLSDDQCAAAVEWMKNYYDEGKPVYRWFRGLERVLAGFGSSYRERTAAHLDLVQEATTPVWSELPAAAHASLLASDLPFLRWEIETFAMRAVICTGRTVGDHVCRLLGADILERGEMARIRWWAGRATVAGRQVGVAGWNLPLSRPTGLGAVGEHELGALLAQRIDRITA